MGGDDDDDDDDDDIIRMISLFVTSDRHMCSDNGTGRNERKPLQQSRQHDNDNDNGQGQIFLLTDDRARVSESAKVDKRQNAVSSLQHYRLHGPVTYSYTLVTLWKYGCGDVLYVDEEIMKQLMPSVTPLPSVLTDGSIGSSQISQSKKTTHASQISHSYIPSHTHARNGPASIGHTNFIVIINTTLGDCFILWHHSLREISTSTALALMSLATLPVVVEHRVSSHLMDGWPKDEGGGVADVYGEHTLYQLMVSKHSKDIFVNIAGQRHLVSTSKALQRLKIAGSTHREVIPIFPYQFLDILPLGKTIVE